MALILKDRVRETATVVGTGDAALLGAVTGFQSFSVVGDGNTCYYAIADQSGSAWEVGLGTYSTTGPTLARTTVLASSNGGSKVVFTGGTKDIFLTYPAEKALQYNASGNIAITGTTTFSTTGAVVMPVGTTAEEPSPASAGMLRFNTTTTQFEGYNGSAWASVGGAAISNDTTTSTYEYPLFASATTGTALTVYTSNANLLYKPSTGELQAKVLTANTPFVNTYATVSADYTTPASYNTMSVGPITINSGVVVTVTAGTVWAII